MTRRTDIQGFNSGKSLNETINEVMKEKSTRSTKRTKLIKLGLRAGDIEYIFSQFAVTAERKAKSAFDFSKLTFGVEIECYNVVRSSLIEKGREKGLQVHSEGYNHIDNSHYYKIVSDSSLRGNDTNEVVSPILKGKKGLGSLKALCQALSDVDAKVNVSCGLHVHIGAAAMSDMHYCRVVRNYQKLEPVIDSFMPNSRRGNNSHWCKSLQMFDFSWCTTKRDIYSVMRGDRYHKVNPVAYHAHKTIEFRQHSGTVEYDKISNWVMFLAKLIEYSYEKELEGQVTSIEDIPFLTDKEKQYFVNRRAALR